MKLPDKIVKDWKGYLYIRCRLDNTTTGMVESLSRGKEHREIL
jgi:hypothetical protein